MTIEDRLKEIEARADAATPNWEARHLTEDDPSGEAHWITSPKCDVLESMNYRAEDVDFAVHARTDVPALVKGWRILAEAIGCEKNEYRGKCNSVWGLCDRCLALAAAERCLAEGGK